MLKASQPFVDDLILKLNKIDLTTIENHDKKYDVITNTNIKYEVKCDSNAFIYGRTGLEVNSWGEDAGILTTQADYYVIYHPIINMVITVSTEALRMLYELNTHMYVAVGDKCATTMALWPIKEFYNQLKTISKENNLYYKIEILDFETMPKYEDKGVYDYLFDKYKRRKETSAFNYYKENNKSFFEFVEKQIEQYNNNPKNK